MQWLTPDTTLSIGFPSSALPSTVFRFSVHKWDTNTAAKCSVSELGGMPPFAVRGNMYELIPEGGHSHTFGSPGARISFVLSTWDNDAKIMYKV